MPKPKHTPGPWKVSDTIALQIESAVTKREICDWYVNERTEQEDLANARLIAAAPEMLEALKLAYKSMEHRNGDCYSNDYMGKCCCGKDRVKQAIAKAEGKE